MGNNTLGRFYVPEHNISDKPWAQRDGHAKHQLVCRGGKKFMKLSEKKHYKSKPKFSAQAFSSNSFSSAGIFISLVGFSF